jgi:hypothetical protein
MIGKILDAATIGSALVNIGLHRRFLSDIVGFVMLAIVGAFMLCAVATGGFVLVYFVLVHYGLDPFVAAVMLCLAAGLLTGALIATTLTQIRRLRETPFSHLQHYMTGTHDLGHIADAFIDGFLNPKTRG